MGTAERQITLSCDNGEIEVPQGGKSTLKFPYNVTVTSEQSDKISAKSSEETLVVEAADDAPVDSTLDVVFDIDGIGSCTYTAKVVPAKELEVTYKQYENGELVLGEAEQQITLSCNNGEIEVPQGGKSTLEFPYNVTVTSDPGNGISANSSEKMLVVEAADDAPVDSTLDVVFDIDGIGSCTYKAKVIPAKEIEVIQSTDEVLVTVIAKNDSQKIQISVDNTKEFDSSIASANCDGVVTVTGAEPKDLEILYADLTDGQTANYTTTPIQVTKDNSPRTIGIIIKLNGEQKYKGSFSCSIGQETEERVQASPVDGSSTSTVIETIQTNNTNSTSIVDTDDIEICKSGEIGFYETIPLYNGSTVVANPILPEGLMELSVKEVVDASNSVNAQNLRYQYRYRYGFCEGCSVSTNSYTYVIACKDDYYLNVMDLAVGSMHTKYNGGRSTFIASDNKKDTSACLAECNGVKFTYAIEDDVKGYGSFNACLAKNTGLLERCKNSCRKHMLDLRTNNASECTLNYVALDLENKKCLCNPTERTYANYVDVTNDIK